MFGRSLGFILARIKMDKAFLLIFLLLLLLSYLLGESMCVRQSKSRTGIVNGFCFLLLDCALHRCLATTSTIFVSTFIVRGKKRVA